MREREREREIFVIQKIYSGCFLWVCSLFCQFVCALVAVSSPLIFKLISAQELTGGNKGNPCSLVSRLQKPLPGLQEPRFPFSQPNCYTRKAGRQTKAGECHLQKPRGSQLQTSPAQELTSTLPAPPLDVPRIICPRGFSHARLLRKVIRCDTCIPWSDGLPGLRPEDQGELWENAAVQ